MRGRNFFPELEPEPHGYFGSYLPKAGSGNRQSRIILRKAGVTVTFYSEPASEPEPVYFSVGTVGAVAVQNFHDPAALISLHSSVSPLASVTWAFLSMLCRRMNDVSEQPRNG